MVLLPPPLQIKLIVNFARIMGCGGVRSTRSGKENEPFLIKMWKSRPKKIRFKIVRLRAICNKLKRTIFVNMMPEPNTDRCASEDVGP